MRYYLKSTPEINDLVYCEITRIDKECAIVKLIEYNNMEALVLLSEITSRKKRKSYTLVKINKKYVFMVKNISNDNKIELSFKYTDNNDKKNFTNKISKYQKSLRIFKNFLNKIERKFSEEKYIEYASKSIWKVKNLYEYITQYYINKNNLDLFEYTEDEKILFKKELEKFFGKLKIKTTYNFSLKNLNFDGIKTLKNKFDLIKQNYNLDVYVKSVPNYYICVSNESEKENLDLVNKIKDFIVKNKGDCMYKELETNTIFNL